VTPVATFAARSLGQSAPRAMRHNDPPGRVPVQPVAVDVDADRTSKRPPTKTSIAREITWTEATAKAIRGAKPLPIEGLTYETPVPAIPILVGAIVGLSLRPVTLGLSKSHPDPPHAGNPERARAPTDEMLRDDAGTDSAHVVAASTPCAASSGFSCFPRATQAEA
jgi:hypothetical protein